MVTRAFPEGDDEEQEDRHNPLGPQPRRLRVPSEETVEIARPACATEARWARTAEEQIADEAADAYERDFWARGEA